MMLTRSPSTVLAVTPIIAIMRASSCRPDPSRWAIRMPAPPAKVVNNVVSAPNSWFDIPTTATASSEMRLTIMVSTVPSSVCRKISINIGQASTQSPTFPVFSFTLGFTN
ncbi:hypothetical protein D3C80_1813240 [compost metagenome]